MTAPAIPEGMAWAMHGHAQRLRRRFSMVEHDDIVQEQVLWWYSHPRKVQHYLEPETEHGEKKLSRSLRNAGLAYCHKEKARRLGYDVSDLYFYSVGLLRDLLPSVYDPEAWRRIGVSQVDSQPRGKTDPAEGNNVVATLCDVSRALGKISAEHRELLELTFRDQQEPEHLAIRFSTSTDAARMRVQRALRRLQEELGGERPDWRAAERHHGGEDAED